MVKAVIIDDEEGNIIVLKQLLKKYFPSIEIVAAGINAVAAIELLEKFSPDLLFLDIEMPGLNGFELLEKLGNYRPEIIFVTAYSEFAVQAFEYQAAGYITKPVEDEKLVAAVSNTLERIFQKRTVSMLGKGILPDTTTRKISLSTQKGILLIEPHDIYYCESCGNYTNFFLKDNKQFIVSRQIGRIDHFRTQPSFMRIHERYIVNLNYVREYKRGIGGTVLLENGVELPVSARRKKELLQFLDN